MKQTVYIPTQEDWKQEGYTLVDSEGEYMSNLYKKEAYVFTTEELKQLLSDTFDVAYESGNVEALFWSTDRMTRSEYEEKAIGKEEYIENLLNKEK